MCLTALFCWQNAIAKPKHCGGVAKLANCLRLHTQYGPIRSERQAIEAAHNQLLKFGNASLDAARNTADQLMQLRFVLPRTAY
jgi:hypothetical protein